MRFRLALIACAFALVPARAAAPDAKLDALFAALAQATTPQAAQPIEAEIIRIWSNSGSPTADLIYSRAAESLDKKDVETAGQLLDAETQLAPDFVAAWVLSATVHGLKQETGPAIADLQTALKLEPRHFIALVSLGHLMESVGDEKAALKAYDAALKLDPVMPDISARAAALRKKLQGDPI